MTNACKFTERGSVTVTAHHDKEKKRLEVEVSDTGKGISKDRGAAGSAHGRLDRRRAASRVPIHTTSAARRSIAAGLFPGKRTIFYGFDMCKCVEKILLRHVADREEQMLARVLFVGGAAGNNCEITQHMLDNSFLE